MENQNTMARQHLERADKPFWIVITSEARDLLFACSRKKQIRRANDRRS
jgi:hypothetical protein